MQLARGGAGQLGHDLLQHSNVVGGAEAADEHEGGGVRLAEQVFQLVGTVGGVDGYQDGADTGGGKLGYHPFGVVGGPEGYVVALVDAQGH